MGILRGFKSVSPDAPANTWTETNLGDDSAGSITELDSTTVTLAAAGTSDPDNGTIAYQLVSSGDIQLICQVPQTYTGTLDRWTFFGLQLREAITGTPVVLMVASPSTESGVSAGNRAKHRIVTDGAYTTHASGLTRFVRPKYLAITYDDTANEVKYWESSDGVADNYEQVGATVSITLSYNVYACLYGMSQSASLATAAYQNCSLGSSITISQASPGDRSLRGHMTWESGGVNANGTITDGLYTDGFFIQTLLPDGSPRTITNVTTSSTPVATYTGSTLSEGDGVTFGSTNGILEMRDKLYRVRNPTSSTFDVYQDGNDDGYNPSKSIEGNTRTDTSGFGAFSGSCDAQKWTNINTASGNPTLPTDADIRVVTSITPPTNDVGSASSVSPLIGSYFLSTQVHYWKDNSVITGNNFNSPRYSCRLSNGQDFAYDEEEWVCWPYFFPSNFDNETTHNGDLSRSALFRTVDSSNVNDNPYTISVGGFATGSFDHLQMDYTTGTSSSTIQDVDLGSLEDDIGKWGWLIIRLKCHATNGILEIWKTTGADLGGGTRAMTKVFTRTGAGVGFVPVGNFEHAFRQYKFGWHSSNSTINSDVYWIGLDEMRFGGENEGTGFADVHPFRESAP